MAFALSAPRLFTFAVKQSNIASMPGDENDRGPLCPAHYERMVIGSESERADRASMLESHGCKCPWDGCMQMYSISLGYFTTRLNDDYWSTTNSSSLRVTRNTTQVICGSHKCAMFMEKFNGATARFRCPHDSKHTMDIETDGPPVYWLSDGYFESPMDD